LRVEVPRFSLDSFQQRRSSALQGQCIRTLCVVSCAATWFSHQTGSIQRQMPVECDARHKRSVQAHHLLETVFMYERSYLTGGGRGEMTASDGNERGAHTSGTRRSGTLTRLATKFSSVTNCGGLGCRSLAFSARITSTHPNPRLRGGNQKRIRTTRRKPFCTILVQHKSF
jgi:hypothetical protein